MPAKNISFNTPNHAKFIELMKATGKPKRQAAIADVLRKSDNFDYWKIQYKDLLEKFSEQSSYGIASRAKLEDKITLYRTALVVLAFIAVTGWVL